MNHTEERLIEMIDRKARFRRWLRTTLHAGSDYELIALIRWTQGLAPLPGKWWNG